MVNKKIVGIGVVAVVAVAAIVVVAMLPQGTDNAPVIGNPVAPGTAYAGQNIPISVTVTDDKGVSSVILRWSNNSGGTWQDVTMTGSGTTDWSGSANIPPQDIENTIYYKIVATDSAGQTAEKHNAGTGFSLFTGNRKAFIVCSANHFFNSSSDDDFNTGGDSSLTSSVGHWVLQGQNLNGGHNSGEGQNSPPDPVGCGYMSPATPTAFQGNFTLDWNLWYRPPENYAFYNISGYIWIDGSAVGIANLGLIWKNASGIARIDVSTPVVVKNSWQYVNLMGVCNNNTGYEITALNLMVSTVGTGGTGNVLFDNIKIEHWISVNNTNPSGPGQNPPPQPGADAFPAQALQVYWTLKNHGYSDDNIFLMLYHVGDNVIDIDATDGVANDLTGATIDVNDVLAGSTLVRAETVKHELNVSEPYSFAADIESNDQLIIFMTDHGSTQQTNDGNATFCFEADNSHIHEYEFYDLVKNITCWRMLINLDCCFSGNFLNQDNGTCTSWYDLPNAILISAASNVFSWYWINANSNNDQWAGSWFFHPFWSVLNQSQTISNAFGAGLSFVPAGHNKMVAQVQFPLMKDNLNINTTWSFTSFPKL